MGFLEKVLRFALVLGLVVGLILFSVLLYVSDFGGTRQPPEPVVPAAASTDTAAPGAVTAGPDPAKQTLQWVFGAPKNTDTTTP